ncbi:hypothetical protein Lal_00003834 [Lupinus albus]|nr:hypothetical protein Lal_00003834 [Lupinus albus]
MGLRLRDRDIAGAEGDLRPRAVPLHGLGQPPRGERGGEQRQQPGQPLLMMVQQRAHPRRGVGEGVLMAGSTSAGASAATPDGPRRTADRGRAGPPRPPDGPLRGGGRHGRGCGRGSRWPAAGGRQIEEFTGDDLAVGERGPLPREVRTAGGAGSAQRGQMLLGRPGRGQLLLQIVQPAGGLGLTGAPDDLGVGGVHGDPRPGRLPHLAGEPVVVGVVMGDEDAVHIGDGGAARGEPGGEGVPGRGVVPAGVDQDGAVIGVEEVDQGVPERVVGDRDRDAPHSTAMVGHPRHLRHRLPLSSTQALPTIARTGISSDAASDIRRGTYPYPLSHRPEGISDGRPHRARAALHRRRAGRSGGRGHHRGRIAAHRAGHRPGAARLPRRCGPGGRGGADGVRRGSLGGDEPGRADRGGHSDQGRHRRARRDDGVGRGHHRGPRLRLRGAAGRGVRAAAGAAGAGRSGRGRGAVERTAVRGGREAGARAARGVFGDPQAVARDAAGLLHPGGDRGRGGAARGGAVDPSGRPRGQRVPGRPPGCGQGVVHRLGRGRQAGDGGGLAPTDPGHAGAGRQVGRGDPAGRGPGGGRRRDRAQRLDEQRTGVCGPDPDPRAARPLRRDRRTVRCRRLRPGRGRPAGSGHSGRAAGGAASAAAVAGLHRAGAAGGRQGADRRRPSGGPGDRLVRGAHALRRRRQRHADRP